MDGLSLKGTRRDSSRRRKSLKKRSFSRDSAERYHHDCQRKVRYRDIDEAKGACRTLRRFAEVQLRPYRCHVCTGYHLTSQDER